MFAVVALGAVCAWAVSASAGPTPAQPDPADESFVFSVIDVPASTSTVARGVNNLGHVVGSYIDGRGTHGFLLKEGTFSTLDIPGSSWTIVTGINNAGQIVGAYRTGMEAGSHGFLLDRGLVIPLDVPDSLDTVGNGINNAGDIVGSFLGQDGAHHGFVRRGRTYTTIDVPGARLTIAEGINDVGTVVGVSSNGATFSAFMLSNEVYSPIQPPASADSHARALNNLGTIVGRNGAPDTAFQAFLKGSGGFAAMNAPPYPVSWDAQGINDLRQIVGEFTDDAGRHGYLATPRSMARQPLPDTVPIADARSAAPTAPAAAPVPPTQASLTAPESTRTIVASALHESTGEIRWKTAIGSNAQATFTIRQQIAGSSGEVRVRNHDGISFTGNISCYHQHSPTDAWFSGTIVASEGANVRGNKQKTATFVMSVHDGGSAASDRVTLVRGMTPFDCSTFHDARQQLTAGNVVIRLR